MSFVKLRITSEKVNVFQNDQLFGIFPHSGVHLLQPWMPDFYLNLDSTAQLFECIKGMKKKKLISLRVPLPRCLSLLISTTLIWNTSDIKHLLTFMSCERRGSMVEPYAQRRMNWQSLQWRRGRYHWVQTGSRAEWAPLSPSGCEDLLSLTPVGAGSTTACEKRVRSLFDRFEVELPVCVLHHTQVLPSDATMKSPILQRLQKQCCLFAVLYCGSKLIYLWHQTCPFDSVWDYDFIGCP